MTKHPNNGPTFSKPTLKLIRRPPPSPERVAAEQEQLASDCAERRKLNQSITKIGINQTFFPDKILPPEPFKRRF